MVCMSGQLVYVEMTDEKYVFEIVPSMLRFSG